MLMGFSLQHANTACCLLLQVDGALSLKCYMQALQICYIRLCHKAELRTALSDSTPRHPHAPQHHLDASHNPVSRPPPRNAPSPDNRPADKPSIQRDASSSALTSSTTPDDTGASSQAGAHLHAEATASAASLTASEATSGEAAGPSGRGHCPELFSLSQVDYCCLHSPFHKLVRKAFARMTHIDQMRQQKSPYQVTASQKQVSSSNLALAE